MANGKVGTGKVVPMRIEARRHLVIEAAASGETFNHMVKRFSKEWGMRENSTRLAVADALRYMRAPETKEAITAMNMARLDTIINNSMEDKDRKNAVRAIDVQNKLAGGYEEKVKIEGDSEIKLVFDV